MKRFKHFTIDEDIAEELAKETNASKIVNDLLKDYYSSNSNLKKQELKNKLILVEADIKRFTNDMEIIQKQIEKIESDEKRIKETFKNIPNEIMEDFKFFDKMTINTLLNRFNSLYKRKYNTTWEEVKKAFCELKGIEEE